MGTTGRSSRENPSTPIRKAVVKTVAEEYPDNVLPLKDCVYRLADVQAYFARDVDRLLSHAVQSEELAAIGKDGATYYVQDRGMLSWETVMDGVGVRDPIVRDFVPECHRRQTVEEGYAVPNPHRGGDVFVVARE